MFNRISRWYDFLNHFLSFGMDIRWRKRAIQRLIKLSKGSSFLDVATGTADMAIEIKNQYPKAYVIGVDPATRMLEVAKEKIKSKRYNIQLIAGDGESLPFKDSSFEGVCIAFGIRNIPNRKKALSEMKRVLKKGGILVILEFSKPEGIIGIIYDFYFHKILPFLGWVFSKDKKAYRYLPDSVEEFPQPFEFAREIVSCGFKKILIEYFTWGICVCYVAFKEE